MSFLYPSFLYAFAFLAIPIVIHLFQFRKFKVVRFSKIDFLEEVEEKNNSVSKLKHLLILLSRILAISFLVFAFARPYVPVIESQNSTNHSTIGIYIDNSYSMNTEGEKGVLLDEAIQKGNELIKALPLQQKFVILSNDFSNETSRILDRSQTLEFLKNIEISPLTRNLQEVTKRFLSIAPSVKVAYLFSDFQKATFGLDDYDDTTITLYINQIERITNQNVAIDSLWFAQPIHFAKQFNKSLELKFTPYDLNDERELNTELYLSDQLITPSQYKLLDQSVNQELKFATNDESKWNKGFVKIEDYPLTFDDTMFFHYKVNSSLNVLHLFHEEYINGIEALFENDTSVNYQLMRDSKIDFSQFENQQLIILDELESLSSGLQIELNKYMEDNGKICIIPNSNYASSALFIKELSGAELLKSNQNEGLALREINRNSFIFQNVFDEIPENLRLPRIDSIYELKLSSIANNEQIINYENNDPFLTYIQKEGKSGIYLFTAPLSINEAFQKNALFVPTFYNMAIGGFKNAPLFYFLNDESITLDHQLSKEIPIHIQLGEKKVIPYQQNSEGSIKIKLNNLNLKAGNYPVYHGDSLIDYLSLNYNRIESNLEAHNANELTNTFKLNGTTSVILNSNSNFNETIKAQAIGREFWQYALLLSLIFFIIEIALLRLMKPIV